MSRTPGGPAANVERFAADLRELRLRAGKPDYRELIARTHYQRTVLSQAFNGSRLPSWEVTKALVIALGGDEYEWRGRWADVAAAPTLSPSTTSPIGEVDIPPASTESTAGLVPVEPAPTTTDPPPAVAGRGVESTSPQLSTAAAASVGLPWSRRLTLGLGAGTAAVGVVMAVLIAAGAFSRGSPPSGPLPGPMTSPTQECWGLNGVDVDVYAGPSSSHKLVSWGADRALFWGAPDPASTKPPRLRVPLAGNAVGWVNLTRYLRHLSPDACP